MRPQNNSLADLLLESLEISLAMNQYGYHMMNKIPISLVQFQFRIWGLLTAGA